MKKLFLTLVLFFIVVMFFNNICAQKNVSLFDEYSSRKFITPVFLDKNNLNDHSSMINLINPSRIVLPASVEKANILKNKIGFHENVLASLEKNKIPNEIFKELFVADGKWTYDKLLERAKKNMTDADYLRFKSSSVGVRGGAGRKFYNTVLKSNFIFTYSYSDLHTQEEEYNRIDLANFARAEKDKKNTFKKEKDKYKFKPVKRTDAGYIVDLKINIFKILLDNEQIVMLENAIYGINDDNDDKTKIKNLMQYSFKLKRVGGGSRKLEVIYNKEKAKKKHYTKKHYFKRLFGNSNIKSLLGKVLENSKEFRIKSTIYDTKRGLAVKIGTKEGLKRNNRFFVYELMLDKNGNLKKKRKGAVRAKKPAKNDGIATGNTQPTKFYQIQGRKLGKGMLLEQNRNNGSLDIGYGDNFYASISGFLGFMNAGRFGIDFQTFQNLQFDSIALSTYNLSAYMEKDIHFARNFYVTGDMGLYIEESSFSNDSLNTFYVKEPKEHSQILTWELGVSAGVYLTPKLKLFAKMRYLPGKYKDGSVFGKGGLFAIKRKKTRYFAGVSFEW